MSLLEIIQGSAPAMTLKVAGSRAIGVVSSRVGHGGTNLPGRVILALDHGLIGRASSRLPEGSILVSATNGKTTTSAMIAGILSESGIAVARNREGANLASGVATALLKDSSLVGHPRSDIGLFEVDEAALPEVAYQSSPRIALLMNLFRDQLDRYGELEHIADLWRSALRSMAPSTLTVLNVDDALIAGMASIRPEYCLFYGIEDSGAGSREMQHASDSKYCLQCGGPYLYDAVYIGHLGKYHCPACGNSRPSPTVFARDVKLDGMRGSSFELVTPAGNIQTVIALPGLYNIYNALAAAAACTGMGIGLQAISSGLASFSAAFGRVEQMRINGKEAMLLLVKNPAGFNEVIRTLLIEPGGKKMMLVLNDRIADGRDISWIWDVDMEVLADEVGGAVCSGSRAEEMAMRLKYAGVTEDRLLVERGIRQALEKGLGMIQEGETLYVLPTYTAMLTLRQEIHQHFSTDRQLGDLVWK